MRTEYAILTAMAKQTKKASKTISFIIPAFNEEASVFQTITTLPYKELHSQGYEVECLIVNNNSTDNTVKLALEAGARVVNEKVQGYGAAYKKGFQTAKGDILVCGDCDGTYPFAVTPKLVDILINENLDIITTNRFENGFLKQNNMPIVNRLGNLLLTYEASLLYNNAISDIMSGMWVLKKEALAEINLRFDDMSFSHNIKIEMIHHKKCRWKQIPIEYNARQGSSKLNVAKDGYHCFKNMLVRKLT